MPKRIRKKIVDPFKEIAFGLHKSGREEYSEETDIWEEKPVSIREFVEGKKYLDQKWDGKRGCRPFMMNVLEELAGEKVREAILLLGKGSGKDYSSSILHLYGIYKALCMYSPQKYYGLTPGSPIYFVNTARNDKQARLVFFTQFKGLLENCPWFEGKYGEPGSDSVSFDKGIMALSANSQAFGWLGFNTIQWVGDELAFFLTKDNDEEESESRARECWEAAFGSCKTRFPRHYKMIGITTPRYDDDFVMRKFYELNSRDDGYTVQAATWEVHPLLTKEDFKSALERDYRRTMRDFGAVPSGVIESFWAEPDFIDLNPCEECRKCEIWKNREIIETDLCCLDYEDCIVNPYRGNGVWNDKILIPDVEAEYFMHFDLSIKKDSLGVAMAHVVDWVKVEMDGFELKEKMLEENRKRYDIDDEERCIEKPIIKLDFVAWLNPGIKVDPSLMKNNEIYYSAIENRFVVALIKKGFNIVKITFDQFNSHSFKQNVEDMGIEAELLSLDRTDEVPVTAKNAFTENRVFYHWDRKFAREAKHLKYIKGKKVDHARGMDKATTDAAFGAIYNAETCTGTGTFCDLDSF